MEETPAAVHPLILTDQSFAEEVEQFPGVVLVDLWATWCKPCVIMEPIIEELAQKYAGNPQVKIAKLNIEENVETPRTFNVLSIPCFMFFTAGKLVDPRGDVIIGTGPMEPMDEKIQELLTRLTPTETAAA